MSNLVFGVYEKLFRSNNLTAPPRASTNTALHALNFWTPINVRYGIVGAKWLGVVVLAGLYFGQPRVYLQYLPFFGRYYDPKTRYFSNYLE